MASSLGYYMSVLILIDGVQVMSDSMGEYLESLFGVNMSDLNEAASCTSICERKRVRTLSAASGGRRSVSELTGSNPTTYQEDLAQRFPLLHLYLLVKMDNRKKHNSHEWFLRAFAQNVVSGFPLLSSPD